MTSVITFIGYTGTKICIDTISSICKSMLDTILYFSSREHIHKFKDINYIIDKLDLIPKIKISETIIVECNTIKEKTKSIEITLEYLTSILNDLNEILNEIKNMHHAYKKSYLHYIRSINYSDQISKIKYKS